MVHHEDIEWVAPTKLHAFVDHTLTSGKSGSGKSNVEEFMITQRIGKSKVIDLVDSGRYENFLYSLREKKPELINKIREYSNQKLEPRAFNSEIIMLCGNRLRYMNKLPANIKLRSLDINTLSLSDLHYLISTSASAQASLGYIWYEYGDMPIKELIRFLEKADDKMIPQLSKYLILRNVKSWIQSGIFSEKIESVDIKEILKNKDVLTSFSTALMESQDQEALVYGLLTKSIVDAKRFRTVKHPVTLYVREISNWMGRYASKHYEMARKNILTMIREGRDLKISCHFCTQRMKDLPTVFRRQMGRIIQLKTDYSDAETLLEICDVPRQILGKLPHLKVGQGLVISGGSYHYPCWFLPALHLHKHPRMDVMRLLRDRFGTVEYHPDDILETSNRRPEENDPLLITQKNQSEPSVPESQAAALGAIL